MDFYEETDNMPNKIEEEKFQKVPIEDTQNSAVEVYNVYNGIDLSKEKCRKKTFKAILYILIIIIIIMAFRTLKLSNLFGEEENYDYEGRDPIWNDNMRDDIEHDKDNEYDEKMHIFYINQKKENINLANFSSPQLRKPENIKLIDKLEITLDLEYEKFIHLKIKDANTKRWELPENDVIDKEYLLNRNDNKIEISKYSNHYDSHYQYFFIELLTNDENNDENENKNDKERDNMNPDEVNEVEIEEKEEKEKKEMNKTNTSAKQYFGFRLLDGDNEEFYSFSTLKNFLFSDTYINFESKLGSDNIYGFGERTHDFKLNEGIYTIWPHDCGGTKYDDGKGGMNQYSHQPIGLHKTKLGMWLGFVFLNSNAQDVIIKSDANNTYLTHKTIGGIIDYYIIVDESPEEVIKDIQLLLGKPPLPPYWSFGYHQSRYGYKSSNDLKEVYQKYKDLKIPIDAMWLDIDSLEKFEMFTINSNFKDIIPYIKNTFHKEGTKFIPIVDIGFSYENKKSPYIKLGDELDIFIKSNYTKKNLIGKVWPGKTVFPDFFHPKISEFWNQGLEDYYNLVNYDGIWLDMNEPANLLENSNSKCIGEILDDNECTPEKNKYYNDELPYIPGYRKGVKETLSLKSISENALIYENNTVYDTKPLLSFYQAKYTYHFLNSDLKKRPFILSRSTSIGSGKYAFHWLGDNLSTFENLKNSISGIFNFNMFGIPFTGSDICGFMENASNNLCIRWYNLGVFYPFSRNHNFFAANDQYPWSFNSDDTINIIKKDINIRYSLLRYMYSQFYLISLNEKGSFFKPLMFEFPEDESSYNDIESKIMFGEAFLLCTFYGNDENLKNFSFPNANFNSYRSGKRVTDFDENEINRKVGLSGKLDEIHLFLRGGYIVPYQNVFDKYIPNSQKLQDENINLIINLDNYNQSKGEIFYDNDEPDTIINSTYFRVDLSYSEKTLTVTTYKNNLEKYNFNDHILGVIEFWRIRQIFEMNDKKENKTKIISLCINYKDNKKEKENIEGIYDPENDKAIFEISKGNKKISLFDINEIEFI